MQFSPVFAQLNGQKINEILTFMLAPAGRTMLAAPPPVDERLVGVNLMTHEETRDVARASIVQRKAKYIGPVSLFPVRPLVGWTTACRTLVHEVLG
eukprot:365041-Chlamydomonas_euryale.AAC.12